MFSTINVQEWVERAGNQNRLAKLVGVSRFTVNNWLAGRRTPSVEVLLKLEQLGMVDLKKARPDLFY